MNFFGVKSDILIRMFDLTISSFLILITLPLQILISLHIIFITGENPFFVQRRALVLEKKNFKIYKFKTLRTATSETLKNSMFEKGNLSFRFFFLSSFLRRSGLDELPQLINVLKGEMSLVGPRPLSIGDLEVFKRNEPELYELRSAINSNPGITGLWQIFGDRDEGYENLIRYDLTYEGSKSLAQNIFVILVTIPIVLFAKHKDAIGESANKEILKTAEQVKHLSIKHSTHKKLSDRYMINNLINPNN